MREESVISREKSTPIKLGSKKIHPRLLKGIANVLESHSVNRLGRLGKIPGECRKGPITHLFQKVTIQKIKG